MSQTPVLPDPRPEPPVSRERAKDYQLETIAQLSTLGTPVATMAQVTGLSERYVDRLLSGGRNEKFNKLRERYKETNLKNVIGSHFQLVDMIPQAIQAFSEALTGQDLRLRKETAQWIWDQVVPNLNGKNGSDKQDALSITINQPHVQTQIGETMANVAHMLSGLRDAISTQDPNAHVLIGEAALPVPEAQLEVSGGPAPLGESSGKGDLLTEVVEERNPNRG